MKLIFTLLFAILSSVEGKACDVGMSAKDLKLQNCTIYQNANIRKHCLVKNIQTIKSCKKELAYIYDNLDEHYSNKRELLKSKYEQSTISILKIKANESTDATYNQLKLFYKDLDLIQKQLIGYKLYLTRNIYPNFLAIKEKLNRTNDFESTIESLKKIASRSFSLPTLEGLRLNASVTKKLINSDLEKLKTIEQNLSFITKDSKRTIALHMDKFSKRDIDSLFTISVKITNKIKLFKKLYQTRIKKIDLLVKKKANSLKEKFRLASIKELDKRYSQITVFEDISCYENLSFLSHRYHKLKMLITDLKICQDMKISGCEQSSLKIKSIDLDISRMQRKAIDQFENLVTGKVERDVLLAKILKGELESVFQIHDELILEKEKQCIY